MSKKQLKAGDRVEVRAGADRGRTGTVVGSRGSGIEVRLEPFPGRPARTLVLMPGSIRKVASVNGDQ